MRRVVTVLGEISPVDLGLTDAHNHVWIDPIPFAALNFPVLNRWDEILAELKEYAQAGGQTILDCQPAGCGRNANKLAKLSRESGVHIVACTGFHRSIYYSPDYWLWSAQTDAIAHHFTAEACTGTQETVKSEKPVRAGFIKIACEENLQKTYRPALEAAAIAVVKTGLSMEIHTEKGAGAENIASFFLERGVKAGQIVLCHVDKRPDLGLHRTLAQAGLFLEYDTFYRPKYQPEKFLWNLIVEMVAAGFEKQITLATDMAEAAMWVKLGGTPGLANYPRHIRQLLLENGLSAGCVNDLMGANIGRCLAQI
jgi:predicted metal-dependent phosphotriesterase family hydrolase